MIKLFWNTHNQIATNPKELSGEDERNYIWGLYHKDHSKKWIYELLSKVRFETINDEKKINSKDILIIIDSSIEKKNQFYSRLRLVCSKMFLIHLGDEGGSKNLEQVYGNFDYIWRTFCSSRYFENNKIKCIPLGYKSGVLDKKIEKRKYKWAFVGTPHKSSRHDLLFQFSEIKPFFSHKTEKFNAKIISADEMAEVLSSTIFMPCPNGFVHPETYRLYEALECGCIPIVENTYKYYDRLFPGNPFIKVNIWSEAKPILKGWDSGQIKKKQEECESWWKSYKTELQNLIKNRVS